MHTLRSVHPLLGTFKRPPELARHRKHRRHHKRHTQHSFTRAHGPRALPNRPACFLQATMIMHAPEGMHPPLGTLKRSPELVRHCIRCACPKTMYVCLCLQPPADLTTSKAGSVPHTGSPASTQAAGAPSCATGLACHRVHTCMWPWETTCPFHSLIISRNNNAHSLEHATTTGDTQEVPRACQVLHKPCLPFQLGGTSV